jgi:uncharacterized protein (DUF1778 family)
VKQRPGGMRRRPKNVEHKSMHVIMRVTPEERRIVRQAAAARCMSLSWFVVNSAVAAAHNVVDPYPWENRRS